MAKIFINLPVTDLAKATAFYQALGFIQNKEFSNDDASGLVYDDNLTIMLLTHGFCKNFVPKGKQVADSHKTCEVLNAIQFDTREEVDAFFTKAINAGGKETIETYDHGFMYGRDFEDLDGHVWEGFFMDMSQAPQHP